jgi:hypothetical protein
MADEIFIWETTPEDAFAELFDDYAKRIYNSILQLARAFAAKIEAWMKLNAPWEDRTSNARQTLYTEVENTLLSIAIAMDHGMEYGFWLEVANQGAYAIIGPALDYWSIQFWNAVKDLVEAR